VTERKPHLLKNGAPAHKLTTEDRRKGAATTNARRRAPAVEAVDEPTQHNPPQPTTTRACDCPRCRVSARLEEFARSPKVRERLADIVENAASKRAREQAARLLVRWDAEFGGGT